MDNQEHLEAIFQCVREIPAGRVMSYGQIGDLAGSSARVVGRSMMAAPDDVPWQRVVGADGYLRIGRRSLVLQQKQRQLLEAEGIRFEKANFVDMTRYRDGQAAQEEEQNPT